MTTFTNNAEGGTAGNTPSPSDTGSGSQWDAVVVGTGGTLIYDSTRAAHGSLSYKFQFPATSQEVALAWSTSITSAAKYWYRAYGYFMGFPPAVPIVNIDTAGGAAQCAAVYVESNGTLLLQDANFATAGQTTNSIPLNQWWRIEGWVTGSASAGEISVSLYSSPDSTTPTETVTKTGQATSGNIGQVVWGSFGSANIGPYWLDDLGISTAGALGPAAAPGPPPQPLQRSGPARARYRGWL